MEVFEKIFISAIAVAVVGAVAAWVTSREIEEYCDDMNWENKENGGDENGKDSD